MKKIKMPMAMVPLGVGEPSKDFEYISLSLWYKVRNELMKKLASAETDIDLGVKLQLWKEYR